MLLVGCVMLAAVGASMAPAAASIDCGTPPEPLNSSVPNVLLIGDSISMGTGGQDGTGPPLGYGWGVQTMLEGDGVAKVQHNGGWFIGGQASATTKAVKCIDSWLGPALNGSLKWSVIHFNSGLHDVDESEFVPPDQYVKNLDFVYSRLRRAVTAGGQLVWASSTPVPWPSEYKLRNNSAVQRYNALAARLWATKPTGAVVIDDLYSLVTRRCGSDGPLGSFAACSLQRLWTGSPEQVPKNDSTGGVHYNARGRRYMALHVASVVSEHLPATHFARWPAAFRAGSGDAS